MLKYIFYYIIINLILYLIIYFIFHDINNQLDYFYKVEIKKLPSKNLMGVYISNLFVLD